MGPAGSASLVHVAGPRGAAEGWAVGVGPREAPPAGAAIADLPPAPQADAPAVLLRTSGSTGPPKAARHSHRALAWCAAGMVQTLGLRPEDRLLAALPFSFHYGFCQLSAALLCGGAVVLEESPLPAARAALNASGRVSVAALIHDTLAQVAAPPAGSGHRLGTSRWARIPP